MRILEIFIDGYKNIKNTRLNFSEPIIVLLSKNNYGKTNLLMGIKEGFGFLRNSSQEASKYISCKSYKEIFCEDNHQFTFEVKFIVNGDQTRIHRYKYAIGTVNNSNDFCVCLEELAYEELGKESERYLLKRDVEVPSSVWLYNDDESQPSAQFFANDVDASSSWLFLRIFSEQFRNEDDKAWAGSNIVLDEISNVYKALTRESIGNILVNEHTKLGDSSFSRVADVMHWFSNVDEVKYRYFEKCFLKLFPRFKALEVREDAALDPYLVFSRKSDGKNETVKTQSFGTRRILKLLFEVFINKTPLASIEELEIGVHPKLFTDVLNIFSEILHTGVPSEAKGAPPVEVYTVEPRLIITSHLINLVNKLESYLGSIYFGLDGHLRDESDTTARFVGFTEEGQEAILEKINSISGGILGVGDIIYDYDENPTYAHLLRSWLEK